MSEIDNNYPGVDRLQYFLARVAMLAAIVFAMTLFGPNSAVMQFLGLALMVTGMILDVMRLRNIGVSQWLAFLRFLPFGSLVLDIGLLTAQPGWAGTRRLDRNGRMILTVELVLVAVTIFLIFWARVSMSYLY